jgi:hypothetical protein
MTQINSSHSANITSPHRKFVYTMVGFVTVIFAAVGVTTVGLLIKAFKEIESSAAGSSYISQRTDPQSAPVITTPPMPGLSAPPNWQSPWNTGNVIVTDKARGTALPPPSRAATDTRPTPPVSPATTEQTARQSVAQAIVERAPAQARLGQ